WLNYIEEFERQFEHAGRVSLQQFLGNPTFTPLAEIPPDRLESELGNVMEFLSLHDIGVDCLAEVSNEELYRFITSELIHQEIDDIRIEGMRHCFIYEEFHPNDEYDAKQFAESFLFHLFDRHEEYAIHDVAEDEVYDPAGNRITREEMAGLIRSFHSRYAALTNHTSACTGCSLDGEYATVSFQTEWSGLRAGSMEPASMNGVSELRMKKSPYGGYDVVRVNVPGFME
ncbi:MAG: hypothetical protein WEE20_12545, partial [Bacteroidota bacterium]